VFLAVPLLAEGSSRADLKRHGLVLAVVLVSYVAVRYLTGDDRVLGLSLGPTGWRVLTNLLIGPYTSLSLFVHGPGLGWQWVSQHQPAGLLCLSFRLVLFQPVSATIDPLPPFVSSS